MINYSILLVSSGLFYLFSFILSFVFRKTLKFQNLAISLIFIGFITHISAILVYWIIVGHSPTSTFFELVEVIGVIFVSLVLLRAFVFKSIALFTMLPACILTLLPLMCPSFYSRNHSLASESLAIIHAILAGVSYACLIISAIISWLLLKQQKSLKSKQTSGIESLMPSLSYLDRSIGTMLWTASISMGVSILVGLSMINRESFTLIMSLKFLIGAIVFAGISFLCYMKFAEKLKKTSLAKLCIIFTIIAIILLIPIELRTIIK